MGNYDLGRTAEAERLLRELTDKFSNSAAYQIAEAHGWRGDRDHAVQWLDRIYVQHHGGSTVVKVDPLLDVHDDPRIPALLRKMNLPE